ncbi:type II toxin-antitoxin system VapC family toxin [soil metagenome]
MIVLDASAVVELVLNTEGGRRVAKRIAPPHETLHAPHLLTVEVAQVLRRYSMAGELDARTAAAAFGDLDDLTIERYDHEVLLSRVWSLRHNLTAYDAAYIALAEALDAPLLTADRRLAGAPAHLARVEVVETG